MKNPFKKQSAIDTLINVGVGGAANVAVDYLINQVDAIKSLGDTTVNLIKIAGGAVVGSMISNKYARLACDGVATVGVSNLISSFMDEPSTEGAAGLPYGTIGRVRPGVAAYRRARSRKVSGVNAGAVMGK
jgi:hypothetical protein